MGVALLGHRDEGESRSGPTFCHGDGVIPCSSCGVMAESLCDYPMGEGRTCDAPLCDRCGVVQSSPLRPANRLKVAGAEGGGEAMHFCPQHDHISRRSGRPFA